MEDFEKKELIEKFSTELRKARNRLDLTQANAASRAGISVRGFQEIEAGQSDPQLTTVVALSHAVNTPVTTLVGRESTSDLIVEILYSLPALNEKQLKSVRALIQTALNAFTGT